MCHAHLSKTRLDKAEIPMVPNLLNSACIRMPLLNGNPKYWTRFGSDKHENDLECPGSIRNHNELLLALIGPVKQLKNN